MAFSETDLIWAAATGLAGFFFLACCVGFCCWRDAQRRSRWDHERDGTGLELPTMEGGLPVSRLARAAAAKVAAAPPPMFAPLLAKGYLPSKRLDARRWRQRGNNVQSKFSKVTAVVDDFSAEDQLIRAYGALSVAQDDSEPRSARSMRSTPSIDSSSTQESNKGERAHSRAGKSKGSKKDGSLGKKAPRREEKSATSGSQANDAPRGRSLSAQAQAVLDGKQPGRSRTGVDKSLLRVQPPPALDLDATLKPTTLGNVEVWPVTEPPPAPLSPLPPSQPPLPPPVTPPIIDRSALPHAPGERRAPPAPSREVPPPKAPPSLLPLASPLPNGGDLLSQIELPADPPRKKTVLATPKSPRRKTTPLPSEDEGSSSSEAEEIPRRRTPRQPRTPEVAKREDKFAALDAELAVEVEAEVTRAVSLAFDSKVLQRTSKGLPCPLREGEDSAKKARKRSSSPKGKEKKLKRKKSVDRNV